MLSLPHLIIIFVVALMVFGPEKLPELARNIGKVMGQINRATNELRAGFDEHMRDLEREAQALDRDVRKSPPTAPNTIHPPSQKEPAQLPPASHPPESAPAPSPTPSASSASSTEVIHESQTAKETDGHAKPA